MILYRLAQAQFAHDVSGYGAQMGGGRWNSPGTAILYTSASRALCTVEIAVNTPLGILPKDYSLIELSFPDNMPLAEIRISELPAGWDQYPYIQSTQAIGDRFVKERQFAVCRVPSAAVRGDFNYLFNPAHPDFSELKILEIAPFPFDKRLFIR